MQNVIYPIQHLPDKIPIGHQTETGVSEIGFNVKPWLDAWDGLELSVWATRPGEAAAYPVADTEMVGNVLFWYPNDTDTAIAGEGKVEIVGVTGDKRKVSGACATSIKATSLGNTQEPPDGIKPYYDGIIRAAEDVKKSAEDVKVAVDVGGSGLFIVTGDKGVSDRTNEEIFAAVEEKKTVLFVSETDGYVGTYAGKITRNHNGVTETVPRFLRNVEYKVGNGISITEFQIGSDGRYSWFESVGRTPNPYGLTISQGDKTTTYDGREKVTVDIPSADELEGNLYVVTITVNETTSAWESNHTAEEIVEAVNAGKLCIAHEALIGWTLPLVGVIDGAPHFALTENNPNLGLCENRVIINTDGSVSVSVAGLNPYPPSLPRPDTHYLRWSGTKWDAVTVEQLKSDIDQGGGSSGGESSGGGVLMVNATIGTIDSSSMSAPCELDMTYSDIKAALAGGQYVVCKVNALGAYSYLPVGQEMEDGSIGFVINSGIGVLMIICKSNNEATFTLQMIAPPA